MPAPGYRHSIIFALTLALMPTLALAETLHILRGDPSAAISVAQGDTITLESAVSFNEASIANPGVADISLRTDRQIELSGLVNGRTTLTILYEDDGVANVEIIISPSARARTSGDPVAIPKMTVPVALSVNGSEASTTVPIPSSGAIVVSTDVPFDDYHMSDTKVIDATNLSDHMLYVLGKEPGKAQLTLSRSGGLSTTIQFEVVSNMYDLE